MVTTKLNLSMTEPQVRQIYAKQGDTGRVLDISLDQTPEDGTLRILRPDGVEVTSEAVTGGEVESGETVTFDSMTEADVTELTVGIEPVQDLNGYDAPWVGGAGKNILPQNTSSSSINGVTFTPLEGGGYHVSGTATRSTYYTIDGGYESQAYPLPSYLKDGSTYVGTSNSNLCSLVTYLYGQGNYGNRASFTVDASRVTAFGAFIFVPTGTVINEDVYPQLELGSTATAWTPYSNICPITGHDEVRVTDEGKNKYPILIVEDNWVNNVSATHSNEDGALKIEMGASVGSGVYSNYTTSTIRPLSASLPQGRYAISFDAMSSVAGGMRIGWETAGTNTFSLTTDWQHYSLTANLTGVLRAFIIYNNIATARTVYVKNLQIEQGSTATAYEPYRSNTYTTSLGQTVYGGTLDMASGVLTVDSRYLTVNDFTFMSSGTSAGGLYWVNVPQTYPAGVNDNSDTNVCSHAPYTPSGDVGWGSTTPIYTVNSSGYPARIYVDSTTYADFQSKYATLQAVYKLAEPVTYQLTAQQIKTLIGTNNVWASSGDIVSITFTYGGLLSELPSEATEIVGKCYCDVEQNGVSSMPFTLNVKKNERQ